MSEKLQQGAFPGTLFECSDNGWINQELYLKWFHFFLNNIPPARPVILIPDGHGSHISLQVIEVARCNDMHLLCLPAHTTHLLQLLDVGGFRSLKSNFSKACKEYLAANPGQVITTNHLAQLLAQAWPRAVTPVNIMSGFKKCGIYPLNPGEISDWQLAPSKVFRHSKSDLQFSKSQFTPEEHKLFQTGFEEGFDLEDPKYSEWLRIHHPEVCSSSVSTGSTDEVTSVGSSVSVSHCC